MQVKKFYARMNKNNATYQIAKHQRREAVARSIVSKEPSGRTRKPKPQPQGLQSEALPFMPAKDHYHIGESQRSHHDILAWIYERKDSPRVKVS